MGLQGKLLVLIWQRMNTPTTRTNIQTEVLSDGSKVYNVIVCSDTRFPDESTATYYCNDEKAAYNFANAIDAAVAKYCA